jgi:hypothetical protein
MLDQLLLHGFGGSLEEAVIAARERRQLGPDLSMAVG